MLIARLWNGKDMREQRFMLYLKPKYEWVLWIDADERITPELAEELKQFKNPNHAAMLIM